MDDKNLSAGALEYERNGTDMLQIKKLRTDYMRNPMGMDNIHPRFSWKLYSDMRGVTQKSCRVTAKTGDQIIWDSGVMETDESVRIRYAGEKLCSRQQVRWRVEVTVADDRGREETAVSEEAFFEMGLLKEQDWVGKWIEPEESVDFHARKPALCLRKVFVIRPGLKQARIYQTAHGLYHFWINGQSGTQDLFKPGLTSYYYRMQYQTYDITNLLCAGENVWAVQLADGWWRGSTGGTLLNNFGYRLHFLGQIELTYEDGTLEVIGSDESFCWNTGGLVASDMQMGDIYDANLEPEGWKQTGFDAGEWKQVHLAEQNDAVRGEGNTHFDAEKIGVSSVPVRRMETFSPRIFTDNSGNTVLDFHQNIAGFVHMRLRNCTKDSVVHLIHGEGLKNGSFSVENINDVAYDAPNFQEVFYTCRGEELEEYCPMFSIFGFRYVRLEGYDASRIQDGDFTAFAVYSAMEETGSFRCSNPLINQLVSNSLWSQKGNFMDVAVDCPTRERNAWTGDAQVYVNTACLFMNTYTFYEKWLKDQTIEQFASGKVGITFPSTSSAHQKSAAEEAKKTNPLAAMAGPEGNGNIGEDAVGWGDSAVWIPYMVYLNFGDRQILENQYETARRWLEFELSCAKEHNPHYEKEVQYHRLGEDGYPDADFIFDTRFQYGEWNEAGKKTPEEQKALMQMAVRAKKEKKHILEIMAEYGKPEVATAYMYRSAKNVAHMARILKKEEDTIRYEKIASRIKNVYCTYLIGSDGVMEKGHQAPYVRALSFGLYRDQEQKQMLVDQLVKEIKENDNCLNTGFLSTPFLLPVLQENGYGDLAFEVLEQTKSPGWLHAVQLGATTIPEEWSGMDHFRASFNHYSYGAVCEFLFQYVAGIRPEFTHPGYREFVLRPVWGGSLTEAEGRYESCYGTIVSGWKRRNGKVSYSCRIPVNTKATLIFPTGTAVSLGSGEYEFEIEE